MELFLFILALLTLLLYLTSAVEALAGNRSIKFLKNIFSLDSKELPSVSIIIPARNEEEKIKPALVSIIELDYPAKEIIVIDDRSTDKTGEIIEDLKRQFPEITVYHLAGIPEGWLGKNFALQFGADNSKGELLLFTDADVVMEPSSLKKAVSYMLREKLNHLTITPHVIMPGIFMNMFVAAFSIYLSFFTRPWRVKKKNSKFSIGIGAFNLIERNSYQKINGHTYIKNRPDDDIKLGQIIKKNGLKQDVLFGKDYLKIEWYSSVKSIVDGLSKNMFAGLNYSTLNVLMFSVFIFFFSIFPVIALFVTKGAALALNISLIIILIVVYFEIQRVSNARWWYFISFPSASAFFIYIICRSMVLTLRNKGINWRGTFYSIDQLKSK